MIEPAKGVVVVPFRCAHCGADLEVELERSQGFGYGGFERFPCPKCDEILHQYFPAQVLDVELKGARS